MHIDTTVINIRTAIPGDFPVIYQFVNELEDDHFPVEQQEKVFLQCLENPDNIYLIAEIRGIAAGFLSCHSQHLLHHSGHKIGEIQEMYVTPEYRSAGVGKLLIDELKTRAPKIGITELEVTSSHKRLRAHQFYLKEGFGDTHKKFTLKF